MIVAAQKSSGAKVAAHKSPGAKVAAQKSPGAKVARRISRGAKVAAQMFSAQKSRNPIPHTYNSNISLLYDCICLSLFVFASTFSSLCFLITYVYSNTSLHTFAISLSTHLLLKHTQTPIKILYLFQLYIIN